MNIREIVGFTGRYAKINREERNYAAIFYHALLKRGNAEKFLRLLNQDDEIGPDFGIYFEYSFLRDLWNDTNDDDLTKEAINELRKEIIRQHLKINGIEEILSRDTAAINAHFGVAGEPSKTDIQSPGNWSIGKYHSKFPDPADFLKVCKFKWSFNIKPDIVIHLSNDKAVCIEAKYVSAEGQYPANKDEKGIFAARKLKYVGQLELQQYMMRELLGIDTHFVYLVQKRSENPSVRTIQWKEAFDAIGYQSDFNFVSDFLKNIQNEPVLPDGKEKG